MFTGIIQTIGTIETLQPTNGDLRAQINVGELDMSDVVLGDSIACNGVCLTAVELGSDYFWADVSKETLDNTTLPGWKVGQRINLEKALTPTSRLGGHLVSGHVDGVGEVLSRQGDARSQRFRIKVQNEFAKYIAHKGSITIDGTSLTVNKVEGAEFEINIVPHTLEHTVIGEYQAGTRVNIEVDVVARYLERLLLGDKAASADKGISLDFLAQHGFYKA